MTDFHCHLDLYPDALAVAAEANRRNEFTLAVTTSPRAWMATSRVFSKFERVAVGLGLHPEVALQKANEIDTLLANVARATWIGEIGIDGSPRFRSTLALQIDIFERAIGACAAAGGRPISIHSRGAAREVLRILEAHPTSGTPILHWFSGSLGELRDAVALGCWFSVGPKMLSAASGQALANEMPPERVLPETDGPFAQMRGHALLPWEAADVSHTLAKIWRIPVAAAADRLSGNSLRIREIAEKS
ncbi:D-aminoacyl-tRNA deacylase [Paraburkholderia nemoris]|uniref:Qat anti-phage system TatD family nuclease QatD n=1 Tax=Paraburkholderia nemoris TaxID=2793076 RepID=UPI00190BC6B9|nr:Qat anti-phage system TatD family nuclease QatD [Paraburkholderia nemoris]MBK3780778.1 hydrolase TatD [Paraburkholderia aspalathi]CAE6796941.1 D-aminoacyl-tRNA deacylase [Paraburkholderia nemoris]